nr:DNA/RNA non-specific endonuclease [Gilliamella apicola]
MGSGTATNLFPSAFARRLGNADDDAGYILAKILGGSGGIDNVFSQLKGINRGQYRAFEKTIKQYIQEYGAVDIKWNFIYGKEGTSPPNRILSFPKVGRMY